MTQHSYASHLVQRGVPLATVAKLLGQSVLTVTARDAHLDRSDLLEAVRVLRPPFSCRVPRSPRQLEAQGEAHAGATEGRADEKSCNFLGDQAGLNR
jgi:hypothetical protein